MRLPSSMKMIRGAFYEVTLLDENVRWWTCKRKVKINYFINLQWKKTTFFEARKGNKSLEHLIRSLLCTYRRITEISFFTIYLSMKSTRQKALYDFNHTLFKHTYQARCQEQGVYCLQLACRSALKNPRKITIQETDGVWNDTKKYIVNQIVEFCM